MPCTEAIACGTPVAATAIEPLLSHLPQDTRWFGPGDVKGLQGVIGVSTPGSSRTCGWLSGTTRRRRPSSWRWRSRSGLLRDVLAERDPVGGGTPS